MRKGSAIHFQGWSPEADRFAYTLGDTQELWLGSLKEAPRQPGGGMSGVQNLRWVDNQRFLFWQAVGEAWSWRWLTWKAGRSYWIRSWADRNTTLSLRKGQVRWRPGGCGGRSIRSRNRVELRFAQAGYQQSQEAMHRGNTRAAIEDHILG